MLHALRLGIEQAATFLGTRQPSFAGFRSWILETAGTPDEGRLARYNLWAAGLPASDAVRIGLRNVEQGPPVLDAAELARWAEAGYAILRSAIGPDEAKAAEHVLWRAVGATPGDRESWYSASGGIMVPLYQHSSLEAARRSPGVHKAFAQLWGTADLWTTIDRMSFNPPERRDRRFRGPGLHWDVSLALPIPFATQAILYLTDTEDDQGALRLVPGFHHRIHAWLERLGGADPRGVDLCDQAVPIAAGAGDLIIWRHELPHGASPNRADRPRMAQYINMYPADLKENPVWR
jgi:hypothetical protein